MSGMNNTLEAAGSLHENMSVEEARLSEIDRQASIHSKVRNFCVNLRDFIKPPEEGQNRYLEGSLRDVFGRMLSGHGTEMQVFNHLLSDDIVLDHMFERTGDVIFGEFEPTEIRIQKTEEGVVATFKNLLFTPKSTKYSDELPGYYSGKVVMTDDLDLIEKTSKVADERYSGLAKIRDQIQV